LCNDNVGAAISGDIADRDGAGLLKLEAVEMNLAGDIGKTGRAEIAQQTDFAAGPGLTNGDEVEPAVIVVVDGGDPEAALPA